MTNQCRYKLMIWASSILFTLSIVTPIALGNPLPNRDFWRLMDKLKAEDIEMLHPREFKRPSNVFRGTHLLRTHGGMV